MRAGIASRQVEIAGGLEGAMLEDEIDFVVISLEEMDPRLPAGLTIAAINERTDSRDALVGRSGLRWASLPSGARIAAGGQGRLAQLLRARSDLEVVETRAPIEILLAGLDASLAGGTTVARA